MTHRQHLARGRAVAGATDHAWRIQEMQVEAEPAVKIDDSIGRLVGQGHGPRMPCEPLGQP